MKIAITGSTGQLGSYLCKYLAEETIIPLSRKELDLHNLDNIIPTLERTIPDLIINCAAYTNVDKAEADRLLCMKINATATALLSAASQHVGAKFIHISTDYVYNDPVGRPFVETDPVRPRGIYAESKSLADSQILIRSSDALVIRTCGLYSLGARNFVTAILRRAEAGEKLSVVDDQICTPTYVVDLAEAIMQLFVYGASGIFHVTNNGACSWYEFAAEILRLRNLDVPIEPISTKEYVSRQTPKKVAPRPSYSVLDCAKYEETCDRSMRPWSHALRDCLSERHKDNSPRDAG